jgi:hypothetical protein
MQTGVVVSGRRHRAKCEHRVPSLRARLLVFASVVSLATVCCGLSAAPASANQEWHWGSAKFGWIDSSGAHYKHAYVNVSYATLAQLGGEGVASVVCRTISDYFDGFFPRTLCTHYLDKAVTQWVNTHQGWYNSGVAAFFYPYIYPYFFYQNL